jgi:hypothetical protein
MLGDKEVGEVNEVRHGGVDNKQKENIYVLPCQGDCDSQHIRLQEQCGWQEHNNSYGSHVQEKVHGVQLLPFRRQKDTLQHRLESPRCRGHDAHDETIQVETRLASAGNDHARHDRHQGRVHQPRFLPERHQVRKHGGEERRGRPDGLVKRHRQEAQRDVAADDGGAENDTERHNFEELRARSNSLHRHNLHPRDGDITKERARGHMAHSQEDREFEAIVAEQILIQQQHANVGEIPRAYQPHRKHRGRHLRRCSHGSIPRQQRHVSKLSLHGSRPPKPPTKQETPVAREERRKPARREGSARRQSTTTRWIWEIV